MIGLRASGRQARPICLALTLATLTPAGAGCGRPTPADDAEAPAATITEVTLSAEQIAHGKVQWAAVSTSPIADVVELPGRLVLDDDHTARLSAPARGRVVAVRANVGDSVSKGQILVVLQSEDAAIKRADLAKATAELTERQSAARFARGARERAERLLGLKAASVQDVERARTDEAAADASATQAQAAIDQARAALSVLQVDDATGQIHLTAPFDGVVVSRESAIGAVLDAGAPALVVTAPGTLWLEFGASEAVASHLAPGRRMSFTVSAIDEVFDARVLRVSGAVDAASRLVTVRAAVANPQRRLRAEMFVTVRAETTPARPVVTVPHEAVQLLDQQPVVFLARPDGRGGAVFVRRDVQTGPAAGDQTPITSGVAPGDVVVTSGAFAVRSQFARGSMPAGE